MNLEYLKLAILGEFYKALTKFKMCLGLNAPPLDHSKNEIVVSLTSYGRRASKVVPYVLYNLLYQEVQPSRILLWLSEEEFSEAKIPKALKYLKKFGVEIKFCKDVRSYKKLIYTLSECRNKIIITIDDDVIYSKKLIKVLYEQYLKTPNYVIASRFHQPIMDGNNAFLPYNQWSENQIINDLPCVAVGVGGVLYPPGCFNSEVQNEEAFMECCPMADDIWFWAMELSNGVFVKPLKKCVPLYPIDSFYQYFHSGSSLHKININENANDVQIKKVFDKYSIWGKLKKQS